MLKGSTGNSASILARAFFDGLVSARQHLFRRRGYSLCWLLVCTAIGEGVVSQRLREFGSRLPVLGKFFVEAEAGRWTAMLATLLQNRIPLVQSLALARRLVAS